tara:strand:- start:13827 stop:14942 length:1116 start_codon:yes stop_codon:yes gene_type:complete
MVVNKGQGYLGPSETFLQSQIDGLPCNVELLIGNPNERRIGNGSNNFLLSNNLFAKGLRWLARVLKLTTLHAQDNKAVENYLKQNTYDAVLAQYGPTAVSIMDACKNADIPLVVHFHGYDAYVQYYLDKYQQGYKQLFETAASIIAVSTHMKEQLIKLGAPANKLNYSACGADTPSTQISERTKLNQKYAMVGRLTEKKAPMLSIIAFKKLTVSHPEAQLEIIGDGPLMDGCVQLSRALNLQDNIIFHGAQPHTQVVKLLTESRVFLQHSVRAPNGDMEGTPVGVLEAMAMGLAVISTKHGGIMDVIDSEDIGILVDEHDYEQMASALIELANNDERVKKIGIAAQKRIGERWTNQHSIDRLWQVLESVMR